MLSKEVRLLQNKWIANTGWPKRLEWIEIDGIRGWTGQRIEFRFPIVALCGENGSGKSTVLQAAASAYNAPGKGRNEGWFASDFFPDTPWDRIRDASLRAGVREGASYVTTTVTKKSDRWRGNPNRRERHVENVDLSRMQPVAARVGYSRLANRKDAEVGATDFSAADLQCLTDVMGRPYQSARLAVSSRDQKRPVPVVILAGPSMSGFHQGAGELTVTELVEKIRIPKYSLLVIDEIETSLHPRAQRRLIRYLASIARDRELQILLTTHSPYVLDELPPEARGYIMLNEGVRQVVFGVSPEFAMTKMDEELHPECDLYVEDERASSVLRELLATYAGDLLSRCQIIPYGAASVGYALGQMVENNRFPRPSLVFVDGDQPAEIGCLQLPGGDAPERVVFEGLRGTNWGALSERVGRPFAEVADACSRVLTIADHKEWVRTAANMLILGGDQLWQAMCAEWARVCVNDEAPEITTILDAVREKLVET
jgi:predicted ATPase